MRNFELYFPKRQTFIFRMFAWRTAALVNRTRRIDPFLEIPAALFTAASALLSPPLFRLFIRFSWTFACGNEHSAPNLHPDFVLKKWHSGGCQYSQDDLVQVPFKKCLHGCRLNFSDWLLPLAVLISADFNFVFLKFVAQKVVRLSVSVSHDRYSHAGNYIDLPWNTAFFLSTGTKYLFLIQFLSTLDNCTFFRFSRVWLQKFRNRSFWSILIFTIVFNLE